MDFKPLENKFEKKKVNTFLVYQKGELTSEYYKTLECENNLFKINSITKSIVSILIGIAIDKGYINDIHTPSLYDVAIQALVKEGFPIHKDVLNRDITQP
ncbi:hypothetical protein ACWGJ1_18890, partial [Bacillus wiedmannii]